jgi:drug/metabolite transporter (DMT)-like permease
MSKQVLARRSGFMDIAVIYILISVLGGAIGQLMLKRGMNALGPLTLTTSDLIPTLFKMGTNLFVVLGLLIYLGSTVFWLTALSRVDLSYAYPFASLSYVIMLVASWQLFDESITPLRLLGTFVIAIGVLLVSRS